MQGRDTRSSYPSCPTHQDASADQLGGVKQEPDEELESVPRSLDSAQLQRVTELARVFNRFDPAVNPSGVPWVSLGFPGDQKSMSSKIGLQIQGRTSWMLDDCALPGLSTGVSTRAPRARQSVHPSPAH